jgi:glycosyltransferase involved in cell wall biosynthesis
VAGPTIFYGFRDSPERRRALAAPLGSPERYLLFGLDQLRARGATVRHNLEREGPPSDWARRVGSGMKWSLERAGGYGGDFATVLASLGTANRADVVFSTVDTVGIPLMLLKRTGRLRVPLVYTAIGLPERIVRVRSERMRRRYAAALGACAAIVAYSEHETDVLRRWLAKHGQPAAVEFVPFGVHVDHFRPTSEPAALDVVSVGADPHRDFELLRTVATRMPAFSFRIVTSADRARALGAMPKNTLIEADLPFEEMRRRLSQARTVALPVQENSYSGATTVLLQAMAMQKPVVVTRTSAIASGYGLVDGENCRLVSPGDVDGFERALSDVLRNDLHARSLAARARVTAERELAWDLYVERIERLLSAAAGASARGRSRPA